MNWYAIVVSLFILFGLINVVYQFYRMAELDARCRGLKHPKIMGLLATSGQRGEGLLVYLFARRDYPTNMTEDDKERMKSRKVKCIFSMALVALGVICLIITLSVL